MPLYLALNIPLSNEFNYSDKDWKFAVGQVEEVRSWRPGRSWITAPQSLRQITKLYMLS